MGDMIITGRSPEERLENLEQVLKRLERYGLKANVEKVEFMKDGFDFVVDAEGPQNTSKKIEAVLKASRTEKCVGTESVPVTCQLLCIWLLHRKRVTSLSSIVRPS